MHEFGIKASSLHMCMCAIIYWLTQLIVPASFHFNFLWHLLNLLYIYPWEAEFSSALRALYELESIQDFQGCLHHNDGHHQESAL